MRTVLLVVVVAAVSLSWCWVGSGFFLLWLVMQQAKAAAEIARRHMAERVSTLIVAMCLCEAWCWANAVPEMVRCPVHPGAREHEAVQLGALAMHYERSTSIFKGGSGVPSAGTVAEPRMREGAPASAPGRPHSDTICAQRVALLASS